MGKDFTCKAGGLDSIPGLGRFPGVGNGNPLQYSCLGNPMDRGAWRGTVHGLANESDTTEYLTFSLTLHFHFHFPVGNSNMNWKLQTTSH